MKYLFANWKMYLSHKEAVALSAQYFGLPFDEHCLRVAVFPSMLSFLDVSKNLKQSAIARGVQNVAYTPRGAYTGAVSAELAAEAGARYALVGHSERRYIFGEDNEAIHKKVAAVIATGMTAILCIGDTSEDLANDKADYRVKKQLMRALEGTTIPEGKLIVAYEPVWAIHNSGDAHACEPDKANAMHQLIKEELTQYSDAPVPVIYGGSVTAKNMLSYMACSDIDGVLVGSASTTFDGFKDMMTIAADC